MLKKSLMLASAALLAGASAFAAEEIHIGALVPEKGALETEGKLVKTAIEFAGKNINDGFSQQDEYKLVVSVEGTDPDTPSTALEKLKALKGKGIKIVVGPVTDAEVAAVKEFADKEKMLLISYGCTSMDYAIANDNIFRILPDDSATSSALAGEISSDKIAAVIILAKADSFGKNLASSVKANLAKAKVSVVQEISFAPSLSDISSALASLDKQIAEASKKYGQGKVAVVVVAAAGNLCQGASCSPCCDTEKIKGEDLAVLKEAAKIPGLVKARWYLASSPGERYASSIKENKAFADFLLKSKLTFPVTAINETDNYRQLCAELKKASADECISAYPFAAYDAIELASDVSRHALASGRTDFGHMKEDFCGRSRFSHGLSGFNTLNENGDKTADDVNFIRLKEVDGKYAWVPVSRYFCNGGTCIPLDDAKPEAPKGTPLMENKMFPVK